MNNTVETPKLRRACHFCGTRDYETRQYGSRVACSLHALDYALNREARDAELRERWSASLNDLFKGAF